MWRRALAFLLDMVPLGVLALIENALEIEDHAMVGVLNLLFFISYFAGMNYFCGGTFGKRFLGLRVALRSSSNVALLLIARAFLKLFVLFPPFGTAYALTAIWRKDGRSLGDLAVGSAVIEATSFGPPSRPSLLERIIASLLAVVAPLLFLAFVAIVLMGWVLLAVFFDAISEFVYTG